MFYDVALKLVFRAFKLQHNKKKMKENMMILKVINLLLSKKGASGDEEIQASNLSNMNKDFMIDFDDERLRDLESGNKRVELLNKLRVHANIVQKQYGHLVDTTEIFNDAAESLLD